MKALKVILIALVVILVVIVGAGATLVGFNHNGHQMDMSNNKQTNNNDKSNTSDQKSSNQEQQTMTNNSNQDNTNQDNTNNQTKDEKETTSTKDSKTSVVVAQEQVPPEEYLKQMQQAMDLIKQGTGLMANAPYMSSAKSIPGDLKSQGTNSNATDNNGDMSKMHEGIYKMAQGNTLMDQAIQNMKQEVKRASDNNISYYQVQPTNPQYFNNNPYLNFPNNNQSLNSHQGMQPQQSNNSNDNMNMNMNMGSHNSLLNMINVQNITYIIYGFLFLSIIGVFFAIFGFINNLFKPTVTEEQRGENFAG